MRSTRTSRPLFVIPNAAERELFYGVNFEVSYAMPQFSDAQGNLEIRPIIAAAAMALSSVSVVGNSLRLRRVSL